MKKKILQRKLFRTSEKRQIQFDFSAKQDEPSHSMTFLGFSLQEDAYDYQIGLEVWTNLSLHFKR